ncbi:MAG: hypothetical protein L6Q99_20940 [Planctomycetes bacterium]|nr:hypothetical protein [Planctomycetota bacterium]
MSNAPSPKLARIVVAAASLWILTGALFKLFAGTPNDLPTPVLQFLSDLDPGLKLKLAISIELVTVVLGLCAPALGWFLIGGSLVVFVAILLVMLGQGAESCGCFGTAVKFPPEAMLAIDSVLLVSLFASRPWRALRGARSAPFVLVLALAAVGAAAPWIVIDDGTPVKPRGPSTPSGPAAPATGPVTTQTSGTNGGATASQGSPSQAAAQQGAGSANGAAPEAATNGGAQPEAVKLPRFVVLSPLKQEWVGKHVRDTELGTWMPVDDYPQDGDWVLFRYDCDHCREHFLELDEAFQTAPKSYVFIEVPSEGTPVVTQMPPHYEPIAKLPDGTDWVIQTPWTLELEGGIVKRAYLEDGSKEDSAKQQ